MFDESLIKNGPWQEFERETARLLLQLGWKEPRLVGRTGDGGADVLAIDNANNLCLFQCKFSSSSAAGKESIDEIRTAGRLYEANRLYVVTSQNPNSAFSNEINRLKSIGLCVYHIGPDKLRRYADQAPMFCPTKFELREYQREAVEKIREALLASGKAQLVLATGLGKTVIVAQLVSELIQDGLLEQNRILVLAHTVPLVNQLIMAFWRNLPKDISTHRLAEGERPVSSNGLTFATMQSMSNLDNPPFFDLVIIDEAHHLGAPEYSKLLERLAPLKCVGVTATPWRSDGIPITQLLGPPVFVMGIKEGLARKFLSDVDYKIFVDNIDWKMVSEKSSHGYTIAQLNKKLLIPTRDDEAIREIRKTYDSTQRKRGLVFSPSQVHAKSFASDLRRHGFTAAALTSDNNYIERFKIIGAFAASKLQFLCTVDIFNEGIDVPDVDLIVFLRVTHSRRIFIQQLGRGLRKSSEKENLVVLDFAADVRRIHAALDLVSAPSDTEIEHLLISHADVSFEDKSLGSFFFEWIADLGNIQDAEEDQVIRLPIIDPQKFNFPEPLT